jgi:hypothetical protein
MFGQDPAKTAASIDGADLSEGHDLVDHLARRGARISKVALRSVMEAFDAEPLETKGAIVWAMARVPS